jgi:hypothetical protein
VLPLVLDDVGHLGVLAKVLIKKKAEKSGIARRQASRRRSKMERRFHLLDNAQPQTLFCRSLILRSQQNAKLLIRRLADQHRHAASFLCPAFLHPNFARLNRCGRYYIQKHVSTQLPHFPSSLDWPHKPGRVPERPHG